MSIIPSLIAFVCAALFGGVIRISQAYPSVMPNWLEHGAPAALVGCLIVGVVSLWKRNAALAKRVDDVTEKFHKEVREEMQAQIDSEKKTREEQTAALGRLTEVLERFGKD